MKEDVEKLKLMTMRPHICAEEMLYKAMADLAFDTREPIMREILKAQVKRIRHELAVEQLPHPSVFSVTTN